jgi:galactokinase
MMDIRDDYFQVFQRSPQWYAYAPGRVNLLGEHVDYNQGPVLPAALDMRVELAASLVSEETISIYAIDFNEKTVFSLRDVNRKQDIEGKPLVDWALYPAGVLAVLLKVGYVVNGMEIAFRSNIPIGAGLSSSAAVEVAFAVLWQSIGQWEIPRVKLAQLCQEAENNYVGVSCGLMDQFASACGVKDHALYFDTRSLEWYPVSLPDEVVIVIVDSGIRRSLLTSEYNERRASCERAVEMLKHYLPNIHSLRDISPVEFAAYGDYLPEIERKRAEHVVKEIARVYSAVNALRRRDLQAFGALMYAGHASLRDLYEVSHPALDILVQLAREIPGCFGARLTGAGFGGCTVNMVEKTQSEEYIHRITSEYQARTGYQAKAYLCSAGQGADADRLL